MERKNTLPWRLFRRTTRRAAQVSAARMPTQMETEQRARFEAFRAQTFPHLAAIYSDALCLTGSQEDAADLTVETYFRAFLDYEPFRRRRVPEQGKTLTTRAWLTRNLHTALCDGILARAKHSETLIGGRP